MKGLSLVIVLCCTATGASGLQSVGSHCPVGDELHVKLFKDATPPAWQVTAVVNPGDFVYIFPAMFEGTPNVSAIEARLRKAVLRNVTMVGAAAMCWYDVVLAGQSLYMSNFGDMFGTILSWQDGCRIVRDAPYSTCFTLQKNECECSWVQLNNPFNVTSKGNTCGDLCTSDKDCRSPTSDCSSCVEDITAPSSCQIPHPIEASEMARVQLVAEQHKTPQ